MAAPNIVNVTSIVGKSACLALTTTTDTLLANAASSGYVYKINTLLVANINGSASASVTIFLSKNGTDYKLAHTVFVPAQASLVLITKDTSIYLEEGDSIKTLASANSYLHATVSYERIN